MAKMNNVMAMVQMAKAAAMAKAERKNVFMNAISSGKLMDDTNIIMSSTKANKELFTTPKNFEDVPQRLISDFISEEEIAPETVVVVPHYDEYKFVIVSNAPAYKAKEIKNEEVPMMILPYVGEADNRDELESRIFVEYESRKEHRDEANMFIARAKYEETAREVIKICEDFKYAYGWGQRKEASRYMGVTMMKNLELWIKKQDVKFCKEIIHMLLMSGKGDRLYQVMFSPVARAMEQLKSKGRDWDDDKAAMIDILSAFTDQEEFRKLMPKYQNARFFTNHKASLTRALVDAIIHGYTGSQVKQMCVLTGTPEEVIREVLERTNTQVTDIIASELSIVE